jgi:uncharacterized surface protein with fasciclin (FAS1) repeats
MKKALLGVAALILTSLSSAPANAVTKDVIDVAAGNGSFKTLTTALKAADLVDTLKGSGPFTVFAPTDEAFAKLPPGTIEVLLKPENKGQLRSILTYHVVPGRVTATDAKKLTSAKTVSGQEVRISFVNGVVSINDSKVTRADILAINGIIHVVDRVMLPHEGALPQVGKIDDLLAEFESKAIDARREAMFLETLRRTRGTWQTHAEKLNTMKNHINEMGPMLTELESTKPQATLLQQQAIEAARPHLEDLARRVDTAIRSLRENPETSKYANDYVENLHGIWTSADRLYNDVDTILDYKEAQQRLKGLAARTS